MECIRINWSNPPEKEEISSSATSPLTRAGVSAGHWHESTLVGAIKQGELIHYAANSWADGLYNPGEPISEPAGSEHVHVGRNLATAPMILEVIYVNLAGKPRGYDAANPGCPFA